MVRDRSQVFPGFSRFAEAVRPLQRFLELVPYEPFETRLLLYSGYNAVTLPASRQGMFYASSITKR
jgi:hypothetical protein